MTMPAAKIKNQNIKRLPRSLILFLEGQMHLYPSVYFAYGGYQGIFNVTEVSFLKVAL